MTGGAVTGGVVTGGAVTGGVVTGGAVTGGVVTGGAVTGGVVTGGVVTGGAVTGGAVGNGVGWGVWPGGARRNGPGPAGSAGGDRWTASLVTGTGSLGLAGSSLHRRYAGRQRRDDTQWPARPPGSPPVAAGAVMVTAAAPGRACTATVDAVCHSHSATPVVATATAAVGASSHGDSSHPNQSRRGRLTRPAPPGCLTRVRPRGGADVVVNQSPNASD